jgi:hypothetical protein
MDTVTCEKLLKNEKAGLCMVVCKTPRLAIGTEKGDGRLRLKMSKTDADTVCEWWTSALAPQALCRMFIWYLVFSWCQWNELHASQLNSFINNMPSPVASLPPLKQESAKYVPAHVCNTACEWRTMPRLLCMRKLRRCDVCHGSLT